MHFFEKLPLFYLIFSTVLLAFLMFQNLVNKHNEYCHLEKVNKSAKLKYFYNLFL